MSRTRVVVTGMGAVTASGVGADLLWQAARDGRSGVVDTEYARPHVGRIKRAAQLKNFDLAAHFEPNLIATCDRFTLFAMLAGDEALAQAGLPRKQERPERTGVIIGTGIGGILTIDDSSYACYVLNARPDPLGIPRAMASAATSQLTIRYGCTGPAFAVSSACSSATQAIGVAAALVRSGAVDRMIVGGSETSLAPFTTRAWEMLRVLTPDLCRPFSGDRNGMVLGEGAAVFILETAEAAHARGATPLIELAGYGTTSDAFDMVRPDPVGAANAMRMTLEDAGLAPGDIDYINAHGTGTVANDYTEAEALRSVFGNRLGDIPVSSTKPIHGHTLGAAGAIELVITIMALREGIAPPTINWTKPDPKCELDPVPNEARKVPIRAALSNSFAFGGINACLIVTATG